MKKWSLWFIVSLGCRRGYKCHLCPVQFANNANYTSLFNNEKVKKLLVNVEIIVSCKQMCLPGNISTKMNFETLLR